MATKKTELEIRAKGGAAVERDLKKIGTTGETTGKKIEKGGKQASKGLKAVDAAANSTSRSMRNLASRLGPVGDGLSKLGVLGLGVAGATVAAGGLFLLTKRAAETADAMLKSARDVGINVEALQEWQFVSEQAGISAERFTGNLAKFSKRIGDITTSGSGPLVGFLEKFDEGLLDALRSTSDLDQQLGIVFQSLRGLNTEAEKKSLADAFFSESGRDMGLIAAQSAEGIEVLRQRLRDLGGVIREDAARNAEELNDTLNELARAVRGNLNNALLELAPTISGLADDIADLVPPFVDWVNSFRDLDSRGVGSLARQAASLRKELEALADTELPGFLQRRQVRGITEELEEVDKALQKAVVIEAERIGLLEQERDIQKEIRQATADAAAEAEQKATAEKKFLKERAKALADIAKLEEKASRAGLSGLALISLERDKELAKQQGRLQQGIINEQEFAAARLAIEKDFQAEKADIAERESKKVTATISKQANKQAEEFQKPFDNAAENIQRAFGDTFTDIFRNGITRFEDLTDAMRDIAARLAGEIAALWVFRPSIAGGGLASALGFGGATASAAGSVGGAGVGAATGGGLGGFLAGAIPGGSTGMLAFVGKGLAAGFVSHLATNFVSEQLGQNTNVGGNIGAVGGSILGLPWGPVGSAVGAAIGTVLGNTLGNLFGAGSNETQRLGFTTGVAGGAASPFGNIGVTRQRGIDGTAIAKSLASLDETIAALLSTEQIDRVRGGLAGTSQRFDVNSFDNESFDVVKTRLVRIIDAVAENTVASGLLNSIGRDPGNIDELVESAQGIIQAINLFQNDAQDLNQAEQAIKSLQDQFGELRKAAERLGFSVEEVDAKLADATQQLTADFNTSIRDQILAIRDPFTFALEAIQREAETTLENAATLAADKTEVETLFALKTARVVEQAFGGANSTISKFLQSLKVTGTGGLSIADQTTNAEALFNSLLGEARTDPTARDELAQLLPTLVDLKREELGSTSSFFEFTSFLDSTLRNLVDQETTVNTLQDIGSAITTGDNAIVTTLQEEIGGLRSEIVELKDDINLLLNAPAAVA